MSFVIWTSDEDEIDLGDPFRVLKALAQMARVAKDDPAYADLFALPDHLEQYLDPKWLTKAREQATRLLSEQKDKLSDDAVWVLTQLTSEHPENE